MTVPHFVRPAHHELPRGHRLDGIGHDAARTPSPRRSTAPAGLFAPAPEVVKKPKPRPTPKPRTRRATTGTPELLPCGTNAAYRRHRAADETPCDPCKAARSEYNRLRLSHKRVNATHVREGCGTDAGVAEHARRKERLCGQCRAGREKAPKLPPGVGPKCGSEAGRSWHRRRNQKPCVACMEAVNAAAREVRAA